MSVSGSSGLTSLHLFTGKVDLASFPVGTFTCLQTLIISDAADNDVLKELPNDLFKNLNALEHLELWDCRFLEFLPEQGWEGLPSLRTLEFLGCCQLKSLPDGVHHLSSLELLRIYRCPVLEERCKEGIGEDWDKIAHIPHVKITKDWW